MDSSRGHIRAVPGSENSPDGTKTPPSAATDPTLFLAALREASEHESHKEELASSKTRGAIAVAGTYFAVVQTATFASSGTLGALAGSGRVWTIALAVGAVVSLSVAIAFAVAHQWPRDHTSLNSQAIGEDLTEVLNGEKTQQKGVYDLASRYLEVTESRYAANDQRLELYYATAVFSALAGVLTTAEIAVSLLSRI